MIKKFEDEIQNKQLTEELIIACLITCDSVISKNAYMEKKWNNYSNIPRQTAGDEYKSIRIKWSDYRNELRQLLLKKYSMKDIIRITKTSKVKVSQKNVEDIINWIKNNDYQLIL